MTAKKKAEPMCAITIGYQTLIVPASNGMKIVQLLQSAVLCDEGWDDHSRVYTVGQPVEVEFRSLRNEQIRLPATYKPKLLEHKL